MPEPPNYQPYPGKYGATCGNCKNMKVADGRSICTRFGVGIKAGWTCDDWGSESKVPRT